MSTVAELRENIEEVVKTLSWKAKGRGYLSIWEMDTDHVYNTLKMIYNHFAMDCGFDTIGEQNHIYTDMKSASAKKRRKLLREAIAFSLVIERRGDLPYECQEGYDIISKALENPFTLIKFLSGRQ